METTTTNLISYPAEPAGKLAPAGTHPSGGKLTLSVEPPSMGTPYFEELYRQYFVHLFRFCFSIVHQKESAEEIVNDVFLKLWEKRDNPPPIGNPGLYLYVSVKNRSLNYLRDNAGLPTIEISERCDPYIRFDTNPETLLLGAETLQRVSAAINQLPPRCKLVFSLIKEDGLKYKDVARLLELSVKTVEAQLAIALRKIAAALEKS